MWVSSLLSIAVFWLRLDSLGAYTQNIVAHFHMILVKMTIFCIENKSFQLWARSEEISSAGRQDAVAFITHKPVISCTNTGHSAPVLLRLLGHLCLDRLGTVWPRAPASPGKTAAMRKWGTCARRSASAVGNDLTVEGFSTASTSNTPGSTQEEASSLPSRKQPEQPREAEKSIPEGWFKVSRRAKSGPTT